MKRDTRSCGRTAYRRHPRHCRAGGVGPQQEAHTDEHDDESENAHDRLVDDYPAQKCHNTDNGDQDTDRQHRVVGLTSTWINGSYEIGVVLVEAALHLFQEALLLLGKAASSSLPVDTDSRNPIVRLSAVARLDGG